MGYNCAGRFWTALQKCGKTEKLLLSMSRVVPISAISMGLLAAFVGFSASFAIVLAGLKAMGATDGQAATGLFFATLGMGICSIW